MRWLLLVLFSPIAVANDLDGVWSVANSNGAGIVNRVVIVDAWDRIYFRYTSDAGHRCEVFGTAKRSSSNELDPYVFKNDDEHHFYPGHESYGFEEHRDCEVSFQPAFESDRRILKVRSSGNCQSFCGMRGSIGGDLLKVPNENLTVRAEAQE